MIWLYNVESKIHRSDDFAIELHKRSGYPNGPSFTVFKLSKGKKWIGDFHNLEIAQDVAEVISKKAKDVEL